MLLTVSDALFHPHPLQVRAGNARLKSIIYKQIASTSSGPQEKRAARTMGSNAHCRVTIQVHAGMHSSSCLARLNGRLYPNVSWGSGEGKKERRTGRKKQTDKLTRSNIDSREAHNRFECTVKIYWYLRHNYALLTTSEHASYVSTGCIASQYSLWSDLLLLLRERDRQEFPAYRTVACVRLWSQRSSQTIILH